MSDFIEGDEKPFVMWAPWTEDMEGFNTIEEADACAKNYGGENGPRYVFELKKIYEADPAK
jgi:hypothetical protein